MRDETGTDKTKITGPVLSVEESHTCTSIDGCSKFLQHTNRFRISITGSTMQRGLGEGFGVSQKNKKSSQDHSHPISVLQLFTRERISSAQRSLFKGGWLLRLWHLLPHHAPHRARDTSHHVPNQPPHADMTTEKTNQNEDETHFQQTHSMSTDLILWKWKEPTIERWENHL